MKNTRQKDITITVSDNNVTKDEYLHILCQAIFSIASDRAESSKDMPKSA